MYMYTKAILMLDKVLRKNMKKKKRWKYQKT